jgi:hypothetical protein
MSEPNLSPPASQPMDSAASTGQAFALASLGILSLVLVGLY